MEPLTLNVPHYPMLRFVVKHGPWISWAFAVLLAAGVIGASPQLGVGLAVPLGVAAGAFVFVVARTLVELVRLITDMLLPK